MVAAEKVNVTVYRCDAPGCRVVHYCETESPQGYHGNVVHVHEAGGNGGQWYACTEAHIAAAVIVASSRGD